MRGAGRGDPLGARNPAVVDAVRLQRSRHRRERGQSLIEGPNLLDEALRAGVRVRAVFATPEDDATFDVGDRRGVEVLPITGAALGRLTDTDTPRGPVAVIDIPAHAAPESGDLLVAYGISDPGNMGALIRTAAAFGWAVGHTPGSADPWAPKVLRAGAGGHFQVPLIRVSGVADLAAWITVATVVSGGVGPEQIDGGRLAVLVGEEASGLPSEVVAGCAHRLTIPMPGAMESLNVAVAAGIAVYLLSQRETRR